MPLFTLAIPSIAPLSDEQFYELCLANRDVRFERSSHGELIIMSPTGGETGRKNLKITQQLGNWNDRTQLGEAFDSSTCFRLPNGADRSPDASWVNQARWDALTPEQREKFPPLCPDFVVELRSASDALAPLQAKMQEYLDNGARLGWLLNRKDGQVEVYRPGQAVEVFVRPDRLSGETVLPGFVLDLSAIW
jgi:Uma2 family endonuclease